MSYALLYFLFAIYAFIYVRKPCKAGTFCPYFFTNIFPELVPPSDTKEQGPKDDSGDGDKNFLSRIITRNSFAQFTGLLVLMGLFSKMGVYFANKEKQKELLRVFNNMNQFKTPRTQRTQNQDENAICDSFKLNQKIQFCSYHPSLSLKSGYQSKWKLKPGALEQLRADVSIRGVEEMMRHRRQRQSSRTTRKH